MTAGGAANHWKGHVRRQPGPRNCAGVDAIITKGKMFVGSLFFSLGDAGVHIIQNELKQVPNLLVNLEFFQPAGDEVGDVAVAVVPCKACLISQPKLESGKQGGRGGLVA